MFQPITDPHSPIRVDKASLVLVLFLLCQKGRWSMEKGRDPEREEWTSELKPVSTWEVNFWLILSPLLQVLVLPVSVWWPETKRSCETGRSLVGSRKLPDKRILTPWKEMFFLWTSVWTKCREKWWCTQGFWDSKNLLNIITILKFLSNAHSQESAGSREIVTSCGVVKRCTWVGVCPFLLLIHLFVLILPQCSTFRFSLPSWGCITVLSLQDPRPKVEPREYKYLLKWKSGYFASGSPELPYFIQASFVHIVLVQESFYVH